MKNWISIFTCVAATALVLSADLGAQNVSRKSDQKPNFSGIWEPAAVGLPAESGRRLTRREQGLANIPLAEWGREAFLYYTAADGPSGEVSTPTDPRYHRGTCGGPKSPADFFDYRKNDPFHIYQTPQMLVITMMTEQPWIRKIWIGQTHPSDLTDLVPFWMGHSVAKWEGDTLVVDTVRIKEGTLIDTLKAIPQSGNLHMIERFSVKDGKLQIDRTFDDPVAFTKPWSDRRILVRQTNWDEMREVWEIQENHAVCDPKGGYWSQDDLWRDSNLDNITPAEQERLKKGLPPVPDKFRQH